MVPIALAFGLSVVLSTAALAGGEPGGEASVSDSTKPVPLADASDDSVSVEPDSLGADRRVAVYYFHRTARCNNCLKFEAYTEEALRSGFARELADGLLEWRVVNLDEGDNEHFVDDFGLSKSAVVLTVLRGDEVVDSEDLIAIWTFLDDRAAFASYIQGEVLERLGDRAKADTEPVQAGTPELPRDAPVKEQASERPVDAAGE